ncbi:MAG: ribonuclease III [Myxococcota bacterium]|jgi:ribonuclease-3|nr:ribonuclease III [Myxococcota bacterium]
MSGREANEQEAPDLDELEQRLGYRFRDRARLQNALQHSSWANERKDEASNERLEFLGDSVLGIAVAHALYEAHPDWHEGELTLALQNLVDAPSLAKLAGRWGLGPFLRLGRTEQQSKGEQKPGILADAVEAILGAIYLDGGLEAVARLIREVIKDQLVTGKAPMQRDPKTRLQEWVMAETGGFPSYACIHDSEVDGDDARFTVQVEIGGEPWGEGVARSKRLAERGAATVALERVDRLMAERAEDEASR